jgi:hypothetical protein
MAFPNDSQTCHCFCEASLAGAPPRILRCARSILGIIRSTLQRPMPRAVLIVDEAQESARRAAPPVSATVEEFLCSVPAVGLEAVVRADDMHGDDLNAGSAEAHVLDEAAVLPHHLRLPLERHRRYPH